MIKFFKTFLQPSKTSNMSTVDKASKMYSSSDKREFATLEVDVSGVLKLFFKG